MSDLFIAGWRIRLMCEPAALAEAVRARYAAFLAPNPGPPDLTVRIALRPAAVETSLTGSALLEARFRAEKEDYLFDSPYGHGIITPSDKSATLDAYSAAPLTDTEYFLRSAVALLAYQRGGLLIHGAALLEDGQAYLFIGQSGSGKTTVVGLSRHAVALGDDLVVVRPELQGWTVYGTPFWNGETKTRQGQTASGPLAGIYKLIQDRDVYLAPMSPAAAAAELLANCPVVNGQPGLTPGVLGRCWTLVSTVPMQGLHFRKDDSFWAAVRGERDG